jgi:lipid II:glycine glycyltransferase (peptidoglycan interpeptide bridge formation enzyme)
MLTNPYTDPDFAKLQIATGKAKITFKLDKGNFAYVFPLYKKYTVLYATTFSRRLAKIAKDQNAIYTLIESYEKISHSTKKPIKSIVPRNTITIDLAQTTEEMLSKMHPKGRYNIKLATKKEVQIKESSNIDDFFAILKTTAERDKFAINPKEHYEKFLQILGKNNKAKLFMAYHNSQPIAGALCAYFKKTAIYYYGASSNQHRNLMAPYLLQWTAIQDAKNNNYKFYDLLGIADPKNPNDPLLGVTYFKQKFGGKHLQWPASRIIINNKPLYFLLKLKKLLRG